MDRAKADYRDGKRRLKNLCLRGREGVNEGREVAATKVHKRGRSWPVAVGAWGRRMERTARLDDRVKNTHTQSANTDDADAVMMVMMRTIATNDDDNNDYEKVCENLLFPSPKQLFRFRSSARTAGKDK